MKKIISLFQRNYDTDKLVRNEVVPGAEWVLQGEGVATRKYDGTCCWLSEGVLYKRYDAKGGKTPPAGFVAAQDPDPVTGHWPGWLVVGDGPEDAWHREGMAVIDETENGTFELIGPKVNSNKEKLLMHELVKHGQEKYPDCPRDFEGIKKFLEDKDIEGIVWHHEDGRMVKIKKKDFGFKR